MGVIFRYIEIGLVHFVKAGCVYNNTYLLGKYNKVHILWMNIIGRPSVHNNGSPSSQYYYVTINVAKM